MDIEELAEIHSKELDKKFPKRSINFGWYTDDESIVSKIYGLNPKVFTSKLVKGKVKHEIEDYPPKL